MLALYEIQYGVGNLEHSVKVFSDRVVIQKSKFKVSTSNFGACIELFKQVMLLFGKKFENKMLSKLNGEYMGIDVPFSEIEEVYFKPATSRIIANGIIVFYLKGRPHKKVTLFNYKDADNAIMFKSNYNEVARQIQEYVSQQI